MFHHRLERLTPTGLVCAPLSLTVILHRPLYIFFYVITLIPASALELEKKVGKIICWLVLMQSRTVCDPRPPPPTTLLWAMLNFNHEWILSWEIVPGFFHDGESDVVLTGCTAGPDWTESYEKWSVFVPAEFERSICCGDIKLEIYWQPTDTHSA